MDQRNVVLYARSHSLNGWRAARLLRRIGCYFDVIDMRSSAPNPPRCSLSFRMPLRKR